MVCDGWGQVLRFVESGGENRRNHHRAARSPSQQGPAEGNVAIDAVRDYRDLKIDFAELQKRTRDDIAFIQTDFQALQLHHSIPKNLMPRLTEGALRDASNSMDHDPAGKLEWLNVIEQLLEPDLGIGSLLLKEIASTRQAIDAAQTTKNSV